MISGIGNDICNIERIFMAKQRFGRRFVDRCFGVNEQREFSGEKNEKKYAADLAKRFAAKEAFVKALGTGFRGGLRWSEIEVMHEESGRPYVYLSGKTRDIVAKFGIQKIWLSLSDDYPFAQAVVVVEV